MKFSELSYEEQNELITNGYRFSTEEITVAEAADLFVIYSGETYFKSSHLIDNVIPTEYLNNKDFMKSIMQSRYPITSRSLFAYASDELKNDKEMVSFAIKEHGVDGIEALSKFVDIDDFDAVKEAENTKGFFLEPVKNNVGSVIGYYKKPDILNDLDFINAEIEKSENKDKLITKFLEESPAARRNEEFALNAVKSNLANLSYISPKLYKNPNFVLETIKEIVDKKQYKYASKILQSPLGEKNKYFKNLMNTLSKLQELPANAKIRQKIYNNMAEKYLEKLENIDESELSF